jgi:hypothetical protein
MDSPRASRYGKKKKRQKANDIFGLQGGREIGLKLGVSKTGSVRFFTKKLTKIKFF